MARTQAYYDASTPQAKLLEAVDRRYPETRERFFREVASFVSVEVASAKGTFYAFLRGKRGLPVEQRLAYGELLGIAPEILDAISAIREAPLTEARRDRLEELEAEVADLREALRLAGLAHDRLVKRVLAVERHTGLRPPSRQAVGATTRGPRQR